ncbi:MAG: PEP-CTERM sorting domain-containing protein [Aquabacterium sp.]
MSKHHHSGLLRTLRAAALAWGFVPLMASAVTPDLDAGIWTLSGFDTAGNDWSGSTITFESQVANAGGGFDVAGYFYWTSPIGAYGRENFSGTLSAANHLNVKGHALVPPTHWIVTNVTYNADVGADGRSLLNGTWGGSGVPSNAWTATQAVPEPEALALMLAGLCTVAFVARRGQSI